MTDKKPIIKEFNLLLLGETNVGKTSIFERFINGTFTENKSASIGIDFETKAFKNKQKNYKIHLYDTAGQERFRSITQQYYKNAEGYFIVFDLSNENSLSAIQYWVDTIKEFSKESKFIILGNKDDLTNKKISDEVINDELNKLKESENNKDLIYLKTSAKKNKNIIKAFETMIDLLENENIIQVEQKQEPKEKHKEKSKNNRSFLLNSKDHNISGKENKNKIDKCC